MAELELVGLHADGEHLVLAGPDGHRHRLAVDDALRSAVRHDRPRADAPRSAGELRPREIQSRLRAGESPEEIAGAAGVAVDHVRRYESPVAAERAWIAQQARAITLGRDSDAPSLGDLVVDRLASRGVEPEELRWSAARRPGEDWEVFLRFHAGERDRVARWRIDVQNRSLHALDDESRWLSEVELAASHPRPHLAPDHASHGSDRDGSRVYDIEVDSADGLAAVEVGSAHPAVRRAHADDPAGDRPTRRPQARADTHDILEGLRATRGVRQELAVLDELSTEDERDAEDGLWSDPPPAHPPASVPHERPDASVLPLRAADVAEPVVAPVTEPIVDEAAVGSVDSPWPGTPRDASPSAVSSETVPAGPPREGTAPTRPTGARRRAPGSAAPHAADPDAREAVPASSGPGSGEAPRRSRNRSRRTSVPSWDEIVFGAKQE